MKSAKEFSRNKLGNNGKIYLQTTREYEKCLANRMDNHIKRKLNNKIFVIKITNGR